MKGGDETIKTKTGKAIKEESRPLRKKQQPAGGQGDAQQPEETAEEVG